MSADPVWSETLALCVSFPSLRVVSEFSRLSSNIVQSSILICRVYKTPRRIGRALHQGNELLGIMEEEVPLLLGEASPNGLSLSSHCSFLSSDFPYIHLEVSRDFNKYRDPGLPLGNTTIQFSISILEDTFPALNPVVRIIYFLYKDYLTLSKLSLPGDSMTQAILDIGPTLALAEDCHVKMQTGPQHTASGLEAGVNIVASDSFSTSFGFLVEHVQAFIGIADKLSEVGSQYFLYYVVLIIILI